MRNRKVTGRSCHFEPLEERRLLAIDMQVRLDFTDPADTPISSIEVGEEFILRAYVQDVRVAAEGVLQAYVDVQYDDSFASPSGAIAHGAEYGSNSSGDASVLGLVEEVGGTDDDQPPPPAAGDELLLFSLALRADAPGVLTAVVGEADDAGHEMRFFPDAEVPSSNVEFVGDSLDITGVLIEDPGLEQAIREELGMSPGQTLTIPHLESITFLDADQRDITSLNGLEYCTSLQEVWLQWNEVSDLSPLSGLDTLESLSLKGNLVSDLWPLAGLDNLHYLEAWSNNITDLEPLAGLAGMTNLHLSNNLIDDVSHLSGLANLVSLNLDQTLVDDLGPLSGLTTLQFLDLGCNDLDDLAIADLSGLTNLRTLRLHNNQITSLTSLTAMTQLEKLALGHNQIADVSLLPSFANLYSLDVSHNPITDFTHIPNISDLTELGLRGLGLNAVDFIAGMTDLVILNIGNNLVQDISPLAGMTAMRRLSLYNNQIDSLAALQNMDQLQYLSFYNNQIVDLTPLQDKADLTIVVANGNAIVDLTPLVANADFAADDELWLTGNPLGDTAVNVQIPALQAPARGVFVSYDPDYVPYAASGEYWTGGISSLSQRYWRGTFSGENSATPFSWHVMMAVRNDRHGASVMNIYQSQLDEEGWLSLIVSDEDWCNPDEFWAEDYENDDDIVMALDMAPSSNLLHFVERLVETWNAGPPSSFVALRKAGGIDDPDVVGESAWFRHSVGPDWTLTAAGTSEWLADHTFTVSGTRSDGSPETGSGTWALGATDDTIDILTDQGHSAVVNFGEGGISITTGIHSVPDDQSFSISVQKGSGRMPDEMEGRYLVQLFLTDDIGNPVTAWGTVNVDVGPAGVGSWVCDFETSFGFASSISGLVAMDDDGTLHVTDLVGNSMYEGVLSLDGQQFVFASMGDGYSEHVGIAIGTRTAAEPSGEIHGSKWHDLNADGIQDTGEPPLAGWTIFIDENLDYIQNPEEPFAVTDDFGDYTLHDVRPGTHVVREQWREGWIQSWPVHTATFYWDIHTVDGSMLLDEQTFTVDDGTVLVTFEFDTPPGDGTLPASVPVPFDSSSTPDEIAVEIADAINGTALNVLAVADAGVVTLTGHMVSVDLQTSPMTLSGGTTDASGFYELLLPPGEIIQGVDFGNWIYADLGDAALSGWKFNDRNANRHWDGGDGEEIPPPEYSLAAPGDVIMDPNDDESSALQDFDFTFEFFGHDYTQFYVNNNGNITFEGPLWEYVPEGFPQGVPIVAPFWADVDTRAGGEVRLAKGISAQGNPFIQVDWGDVGYYDTHADLLNTFTLYIEDDPAGDIVAFVYGPMQWTTGDIDGQYGFGGEGAQIGFDAGNNSDHISLGRPASAAELSQTLADGEFAFRFDPQSGTPYGAEPGLAGVTVYIDANNNRQLDPGEPTTVTRSDDPATGDVDETGYYEFTGLDEGAYTVREVVQPGWGQTYPGPQQEVLPDGSYSNYDDPEGWWTAGLTAGEWLEDVNFGNVRLLHVEDISAGVDGLSIDLREGTVLPDGPTVITVQLDGAMNWSDLDETDVELVGAVGGNFVPSVDFDPAMNTVTFDFGYLPDDVYTLTLRSGDGQFENPPGYDLDGEADVAATVPSGDGAAGGDFVVGFYADYAADEQIPVSLPSMFPEGGLIYGGGVEAYIGSWSDTDGAVLEVDDGQTITVSVMPLALVQGEDLQPFIELTTPDGSVIRREAAAAGQSVLLQTVHTKEIGGAGQYAIVVGGVSGSTGAYHAELVLNAAAEEEMLDLGVNGDMGSAQDLDESFISLDRLLAGQVTRVTGTETIPGDGRSFFEDFGIFNDDLYFAADGGLGRRELWRYDCFTAEPVDGSPIRRPEGFLTFNDALYFSANDDVHGQELWRYDGESFERLSDVNPGPGSSFPACLTIFNGDLYFAAYEPRVGIELWKYRDNGDGVVDNDVSLVADVNPAAMNPALTHSSFPSDLAVFGDRLYFAADDGTHGYELWACDGNNVQMVADLAPEGEDSSPKEMIVFEGALYFAACGEDPVLGLTMGRELWRYDGGEVALMADVADGQDYACPDYLVEYRGDLYFQATDGAGGYALWKFDGQQVSMVEDFFPEGGHCGWHGSQFTALGDDLYFVSDDGIHGDELWKYNGETETFTPLPEVPMYGHGADDHEINLLNQDMPHSGFRWEHGDALPGGRLMPYHGELYFGANDGHTGMQFYKYTPPVAPGSQRAGATGEFADDDDEDWYSFTLGDGQSTFLQVEGEGPIPAELYDSSGNLLASNSNGFVDPVDGHAATYYVKVGPEDTSAVVNASYGLVVTRDAHFNIADRDVMPDTQDLPQSGVVMGQVLPGDWDYYRINLAAGPHTIATVTRADGPGEFLNLVDPRIELYDPVGNLVAADEDGGPDKRNAYLEYTVDTPGTYTVGVAGQTPGSFGEYVLSVKSEHDPLPAGAVVSVDLDGARATIHGTDGDDAFEFTADAPHEVVVNGVSYDIGPATSISLLGGGGSDTAVLTGSDGDDSAVLAPGYGLLQGEGFEITATDFGSVTARASEGEDVVRIYDSPGNDLLVGTPGRVDLTGAGFALAAESFDLTHVFASADGYDVAELHDSSGDDSFYASPSEAGITAGEFVTRLKHFDEVAADASAGGNDEAHLFDSPARDTFIATPRYAALSGTGFHNRATNFDNVRAEATAGDYDVARLYDSSGDDVFWTTPTYGALTGDGFYNQAVGFEGVNTYAFAGGYDTGKMYDSPGDDTFYGAASESMIWGPGFYHRAKDFEEVRAFATAGGADTAMLFDSSGNDRFTASPVESSLQGEGFFNRVKYFERVFADAGAGGYDEAYLFDSPEADLLEAGDDTARLSNASLDFLFEAASFDYVKATSSTPGDKKDVASAPWLDLEGPWEDLLP